MDYHEVCGRVFHGLNTSHGGQEAYEHQGDEDRPEATLVVEVAAQNTDNALGQGGHRASYGQEPVCKPVVMDFLVVLSDGLVKVSEIIVEATTKEHHAAVLPKAVRLESCGYRDHLVGCLLF